MLTMLVRAGFAQTASTQGKEFWVALIPSQAAGSESETGKQNPSSSSNEFQPYIAISAPKNCTVKISNPNTNWSTTHNVTAQSWHTVTDIPVDQWYTSSAMPESETVYNFGLKVESSEDVSVYCALRWSQSFDASNILPITTLQSDYLVQTYGPTSASNGHHSSDFSILAAEDCTVDITPSVATKKGKAANTKFSIQLKAGQVYHVLSATDKDLSGSKVVARNGKKIALFAGCPIGRVPNEFSDRDILYEQLFPTDYWGNHFIVTRSLQKDANRVKLTAMEDATKITIYGRYQATAAQTDNIILKDYVFTLNAGESYEFEMSSGNASGRWDAKRANFTGITIIDTTTYIETKCPISVISYDTGNGYKRKDASELVQKPDKESEFYGAPSMTWVSPLEQMISDIVFGLMKTSKTERHFVNIVTSTSNVSTMTMNGNSLSSYFKPVESNPNYSYMRYAFSTKEGFYHLQGKDKFIATVYGNGFDESYAYSVGSAAIKRAIDINGTSFTDGKHAEDPFCLNEELTFTAETGSDIIKRVDWDFGDGVSELNAGREVTHRYESTGWYDVTANIYAYKECPDTVYPAETVHFSFRIKQTDTIADGIVLCQDDVFEGKTYDTPGTFTADPVVIGHCDTVKLFTVQVGKKQTVQLADTTVNDSVWWNGRFEYGSNGETRTLTDTLRTWFFRCDSIVSRDVTFRSCLRIRVQTGNLQVCSLEPVSIPYVVEKGGISDATLEVNGQTLPLTWDGQFFHCETGLPKAGTYSATLRVTDAETACNQVIPFTFDVTALFPKTVFQQKWNDVLAVLNAKYNGGYTFTAYQWLKNGQPIEGATGSWYQVPEGLDAADEYSVLLTTADGLTLPSCPRHGGDKTGGNGDGNNGSNGDGNGGIDVNPGGILPGGGMMFIRAKGQGTASLYSTMGQPEGSISFTNEGSIRMPERSGIYVLDIRMADGTKKSVHVMVQ